MIRRVLALLTSLCVLAALLLVAGNLWVISQAGPIRHDPAELAVTDVALVLGTSHYSAEGRPNRHFQGRMDAAAELYQAGMVRHVLASGANPEIYYNEPQRMFEALTERGVPAENITLDFAGRRTLDSLIRARRIFGQSDVTIISQPYHLYRAMYLARAAGIQAQAYAAAQPPLSARWTIEAREALARLLALLDVHVLGTEAQVLGEPEPIELATPSP